MRKIFILAPLLALLTLLTGCAVGFGPMVGTRAGLFTGISAPVAVGPADSYSKVGTASYVNVLGLVAIGDAGMEKAMANGNITKIHHVDYKAMNVLMLFEQVTVYVYGE